MAESDNRTLCVCPECRKVYWQWHRGEWTGARRAAVGKSAWVKEMCDANRQRTDMGNWYGHALCAECAEKRLPPALRMVIGKWVREGEEPCDC